MASPVIREALMEQSLPSGEHFTSIAHTTLDNSNFLFAGTNGGKLYQVRQSSVLDLNSNPKICCEFKAQLWHSKLSGCESILGPGVQLSFTFRILKTPGNFTMHSLLTQKCSHPVWNYNGLLVAHWLKHWTADRKAQGSSPTCSLLGALSPTSKIE